MNKEEATKKAIESFDKDLPGLLADGAETYARCVLAETPLIVISPTAEREIITAVQKHAAQWHADAVEVVSLRRQLKEATDLIRVNWDRRMDLGQRLQDLKYDIYRADAEMSEFLDWLDSKTPDEKRDENDQKG